MNSIQKNKLYSSVEVDEDRVKLAHSHSDPIFHHIIFWDEWILLNLNSLPRLFIEKRKSYSDFFNLLFIIFMTITIYTKDYCPYCVKAKSLLSSLGANYEEVDITNSPDTIMELVKKSGMRTVPQIFVWDECLGGYDSIAKLHEEGKLLEKIGL